MLFLILWGLGYFPIKLSIINNFFQIFFSSTIHIHFNYSINVRRTKHNYFTKEGGRQINLSTEKFNRIAKNCFRFGKQRHDYKCILNNLKYKFIPWIMKGDWAFLSDSYQVIYVMQNHYGSVSG